MEKYQDLRGNLPRKDRHQLPTSSIFHSSLTSYNWLFPNHSIKITLTKVNNKVYYQQIKGISSVHILAVWRICLSWPPHLWHAVRHWLEQWHFCFIFLLPLWHFQPQSPVLLSFLLLALENWSFLEFSSYPKALIFLLCFLGGPIIHIVLSSISMLISSYLYL